MTADILIRDAGFRAWLAALPGFWVEVGAVDDAGALVVLMAERRRLGLPPIAGLQRVPTPRRRIAAAEKSTRARGCNQMSGGRP